MIHTMAFTFFSGVPNIFSRHSTLEPHSRCSLRRFFSCPRQHVRRKATSIISCLPQADREKQFSLNSVSNSDASNTFAKLFLYRIPLLPENSGYLRSGYICSCLVSAAFGRTAVGLTGIVFLFVAALTEAPVTIASVSALIVASILDLSRHNLLGFNESWSMVFLSYTSFGLGVAIMTCFDDDVRLGINGDGGIASASSTTETAPSDQPRATYVGNRDSCKSQEHSEVHPGTETSAEDFKRWDDRFLGNSSEDDSSQAAVDRQSSGCSDL